MNSSDNKTRRSLQVPLAVCLPVCILPAVLTVLFYLLRPGKGVMDWVVSRIGAPIRGVFGLLSSVYPFSLMEILCAAAAIWFVYYIVRTIIVTARRREKLRLLAKRLLPLAVAALYIWAAFCWLWSSGYHASGFAERNGFSGGGATVDELIAAASLFAARANDLSSMVMRDEDGRFIEDRREFFGVSTQVYRNIAVEFPDLEGRLYAPKPMMFSWLMSRTGYTGIYFALTGESNINVKAPACLMPATVAHEMAHQRGVFSEDEANFVGILACVTSGYPVYEYSGYLMGLVYLRNALFFADFQAWADIGDSLSFYVSRDLQENYDFWQSQKTVETGVDFFDNVFTAVTESVSNTVETVYDGYLKAQNQELGVRSYGACVDLLVEYYSALRAQGTGIRGQG